MEDNLDNNTEQIWQIANEFTTIHVKKVWTKNGERLEITSKKFGYSIRLDAMQLESLTWQKPELFSKLLATPLGPEDEKGSD